MLGLPLPTLAAAIVKALAGCSVTRAGHPRLGATISLSAVARGEPQVVFGAVGIVLAAFFAWAAWDQHVHPFEQRFTGELRAAVPSSLAVRPVMCAHPLLAVWLSCLLAVWLCSLCGSARCVALLDV